MINLLCLPHAGGSAMNYYNMLSSAVGWDIKVVPVEIPGRGKRFCEPLIEDFDELVNLLINEIKDIIMSQHEYSLFGYSMGSRLAFELYYKIMELGLKGPLNMFFLASESPKYSEKYRDLDDESIKKAFIMFGGTPQEVLENEELVELFLPIMRADLMVVNSFKYNPHIKKIDCPIIVINGTKDEQTIEYIEDWKNYSSKSCEFIFYEGGHFFIHDNVHEIGRIISEKIHRDL